VAAIERADSGRSAQRSTITLAIVFVVVVKPTLF